MRLEDESRSKRRAITSQTKLIILAEN